MKRIKFIILFVFLANLTTFGQTSEKNSFKLKAVGFQNYKTQSWDNYPAYKDFRVLANNNDSALNLDNYGFEIQEGIYTIEKYFSGSCFFYKTKNKELGAFHRLELGFGYHDVSFDQFKALGRSKTVLLDSSVMDYLILTVDSCILHEYNFIYDAQRVSVNLGYAYEFDMGNFLSFSFGVNTSLMYRYDGYLISRNNVQTELSIWYYDTIHNHKTSLGAFYKTQYSNEKDYKISDGFALRAYVPISFNYKLLDFKDKTQWLIVNLSAAMGYDFNFDKGIKTTASKIYSYGFGLKYML
jgi:hypothetical protein